ncbi:MAG: hypothetical protein AB7F28_08370 [Candidatus Margulisiibacteriota bacterium]
MGTSLSAKEIAVYNKWLDSLGGQSVDAALTAIVNKLGSMQQRYRQACGQVVVAKIMHDYFQRNKGTKQEAVYFSIHQRWPALIYDPLSPLFCVQNPTLFLKVCQISPQAVLPNVNAQSVDGVMTVLLASTDQFAFDLTCKFRFLPSQTLSKRWAFHCVANDQLAGLNAILRPRLGVPTPTRFGQWVDSSGNSLLHHAVVSGAQRCFQEILKAEPSLIGLANSAGNTPLHLAIIHDRDFALKQLVATESSLDLPNHAGQTARQLLVAKNDLASVTTLEALLTQRLVDACAGNLPTNQKLNRITDLLKMGALPQSTSFNLMTWLFNNRKLVKGQSELAELVKQAHARGAKFDDGEVAPCVTGQKPGIKFLIVSLGLPDSYVTQDGFTLADHMFLNPKAYAWYCAIRKPIHSADYVQRLTDTTLKQLRPYLIPGHSVDLLAHLEHLVKHGGRLQPPPTVGMFSIADHAHYQSRFLDICLEGDDSQLTEVYIRDLEENLPWEISGQHGDDRLTLALNRLTDLMGFHGSRVLSIGMESFERSCYTLLRHNHPQAAAFRTRWLELMAGEKDRLVEKAIRQLEVLVPSPFAEYSAEYTSPDKGLVNAVVQTLQVYGPLILKDEKFQAWCRTFFDSRDFDAFLSGEERHAILEVLIKNDTSSDYMISHMVIEKYALLHFDKAAAESVDWLVILGQARRIIPLFGERMKGTSLPKMLLNLLLQIPILSHEFRPQCGEIAQMIQFLIHQGGWSRPIDFVTIKLVPDTEHPHAEVAQTYTDSLVKGEVPPTSSEALKGFFQLLVNGDVEHAARCLTEGKISPTAGFDDGLNLLDLVVLRSMDSAAPTTDTMESMADFLIQHQVGLSPEFSAYFYRAWDRDGSTRLLAQMTEKDSSPTASRVDTPKLSPPRLACGVLATVLEKSDASRKALNIRGATPLEFLDTMTKALEWFGSNQHAKQFVSECSDLSQEIPDASWAELVQIQLTRRLFQIKETVPLAILREVMRLKFATFWYPPERLGKAKFPQQIGNEPLKVDEPWASWARHFPDSHSRRFAALLFETIAHNSSTLIAFNMQKGPTNSAFAVFRAICYGCSLDQWLPVDDAVEEIVRRKVPLGPLHVLPVLPSFLSILMSGQRRAFIDAICAELLVCELDSVTYFIKLWPHRAHPILKTVSLVASQTNPQAHKRAFELATTYDHNGYSRLSGFNRDGFHRDTHTQYNPEGFNRDGYNKEGLDKDGYNRSGRNREGFDRTGYDLDGLDSQGFHRTSGFNLMGLDRNGFNKDGYSYLGYDKEGFNRNGRDRHGRSREYLDIFCSHSPLAYSWNGYNRAGYNRDGFHIDGYNRWGYDLTGLDARGYDRWGYNRAGYDDNRYNRRGYNRNGFNKAGIHFETRTRYNPDGFDKDGVDREGYDTSGFNSRGFDREGLDRNLCDHSGRQYYWGVTGYVYPGDGGREEAWGWVERR